MAGEVTDVEDKPRLTAAERDAIQKLHVAQQMLADAPEDNARRAGMVPGGRRLLGTARGMLAKFMSEAYHTVRTDQLRTLVRTIEMTSLAIGVRCNATMNNDAQRLREYGVVVPMDALNEILTAAGEHCDNCMLDTEGQRRCPLRRAFDAIPNDVVTDKPECGYFLKI